MRLDADRRCKPNTVNWGLVKCDISIERRGTKAIYRADKLVLGVCIDLDGNAPIGDNFFDLFPNKPYEVELGGLTGEVLYTALVQGD